MGNTLVVFPFLHKINVEKLTEHKELLNLLDK